MKLALLVFTMILLGPLSIQAADFQYVAPQGCYEITEAASEYYCWVVPQGESASWTSIRKYSGTYPDHTNPDGASTTPSTVTNFQITNQGAPFFWRMASSTTDYIYQVTNEFLSIPATTTRIMSPWNPNAGDIEPTNLVNFIFSFYHNTAPGNTVYEKLGVQIVNNTSSYTYNTESIEVDILASGSLSYSNVYSLPTGDAFSWRAYARTGTTYVYGPWLSFSVVEQNTEASPFTQYPDDLSATSTSEFGFISGIANMIFSKPPFLWFSQINNTIGQIDYNATSTPELKLTASSTIFGEILGGDTEIQLLSEDIFEQYIPDNIHTIFMTLQLVVFYLAGGMYVMRRTFAFFQPQQ